MNAFSTYVGLDVHKDSITLARAGADRGPVRLLGRMPHDLSRLRHRLSKLGSPGDVQVCYEAGPTGYGLQRRLSELGYDCRVVAPSRTPRGSADRIKTDRRDAERLAHFLRSGDLTFIRVPTPEEEAMRNLLRAREDAKRAEHKAKQQLNMFLLRCGRIWPGKSRWTRAHMQWVGSQAFEHEADLLTLADYLHTVERHEERVEELTNSIETLAPKLRCYPLIQAFEAFRGIKLLLATWLAIEIGDFRRFPTAGHFMSFLGLTPSESSSGATVRRGAITKAGNARMRSLLMQAAWAYRLKPRVEGTLRRRNQAASEAVREIAWKAQNRLHRKLYRLTLAGKPKNKALVAVARELAGFIWAASRQAVPAAETT
jgi:transposase